MSWATRHIEVLRAGKSVSFRPRGNSMTPYIESGQLVTVEPLSQTIIPVIDDIVLARVHGRDYLHFVTAVKVVGGTRIYQVGNARTRINGWASEVYGVACRGLRHLGPLSHEG